MTLAIIVLPVLVLIQTVFTQNSLNQIRYEDLAESVRNPFFMQNGFVYDGISSALAWYGILAFVYNIFGFSIFTAKYVRLFIYAFSLLATFLLLKKYLGEKKLLVPVITIGLSPALLYFNTIQTMGSDLLYLPIALWFLSKNYQISFWVTNMVAWLSHPVYIFYLPALSLAYFFSLYRKKISKTVILRNIMIASAAFITPLAVFLFFIKNRQLLIYDPSSGSGLFRAGVTKGIDFSIFLPSLKVTLSDFFSRANSYYFEVSEVEFSGVYPILTFLAVFFIAIYIIIKKRKERFVLGLALLTIILNLVLAHITGGRSELAGIRRNTPVLASFYLLFIISWQFVLTFKFKDKLLKYSLILIMLTLPAHHLLVLPKNLKNTAQLSPYRERGWFELSGSPGQSLKVLVDQVKHEDLTLGCKDSSGKFITCRYSEIYPAIAGSCQWNRLACHQISGYDETSKQFIPLSVDLWLSYTFAH